MKYIDSNIFIYAIIYDENEIEDARISKSILERVVKGEINACTSCLTWDEAVYVVLKVLGSDDAKRAGSNILLFPNLRIFDIDKRIIDCASGLIEKYNLKPRDSIHAASAIQNGIKDIITNDMDFEVVEELCTVGLNDV